MFLLLKFNAFQSSTKDITTLFINDGIISNLKKCSNLKKSINCMMSQIEFHPQNHLHQTPLAVVCHIY